MEELLVVGKASIHLALGMKNKEASQAGRLVELR